MQLLEGENVFTLPQPHLIAADQPTHVPSKVHYDAGVAPARVGRYCSIHDTTIFMQGGEHHHDAVTTFAFWWHMQLGEPEDFSVAEPITVGCDAWIGRESILMSGVNIGNGAVVATRAVVTKDVAPYEIVGGVPARHLGWRFDEQTRQELLKIAWWDWPFEKVLAHRTQLYGRGDAVVDFIARHGGKVDAMTAAEQCEICDTK